MRCPDANLAKAVRNAGYKGPALMVSGYYGDIVTADAERLNLNILVKPVRYFELVAYLEHLQGIDTF